MPPLKTAQDMQQMLSRMETRFNASQSNIRQFATVWNAAVFGALGFLVTTDSHMALSVPFLAVMVLLLGCLGLLLLWHLDQRVYQHLLNLAFTYGLHLEASYPALLPIRLHIYNHTGLIGRHVGLFYQVPFWLFFAAACTVLLNPLLLDADSAAMAPNGERIFAGTALAVTFVTFWLARPKSTFMTMVDSLGDDLRGLVHGPEERLAERVRTVPPLDNGNE